MRGCLTSRLSWKVEAWYWAYLAMVVCERLLSQGHVWVEPLGSQFSSAGCWTWVLTSTAWSELASTRDLVENRPRSCIWKRTQRQWHKTLYIHPPPPFTEARVETEEKIYFGDCEMHSEICKCIRSSSHPTVVARPSRRSWAYMLCIQMWKMKNQVLCDCQT